MVIDLFDKYADFNNATFGLVDPAMDKFDGGILDQQNQSLIVNINDKS